MNRDFIEEINNKDFKDITFSLYNKIDDDYYPKLLGKKNNTTYDVDDFEYCVLDLDKKEQFLLKMHNKEIVSSIKKMKNELEKKDYKIIIDYIIPNVSIVRLKEKK